MRVTVTDLSFRYSSNENWLFRDISVTVPSGTLLAVTGPSGCGKSTFLDLLGGLRKADSGHIIMGETRESYSEKKFGEISWILQNTPVLGGRSAIDNVAFALLPLGTSMGDARAQARAAIKEVGLDHRRNAKIGEMSGGEVQRVAIARSIVSAARLALADEPTGQLDARNTAATIQALRATAASGRTVIIATHDQWVVEQCDMALSLRAEENYV
ncbi:ABC transporter ATP-binding protein [Microbacterium sp. 22242]|uniref:ABC transporter ATP-binding protein n=1 Tax=Microbacterium sp. 22242 TaxID=3453896 RepID=UPI003F86F07E